MELAVEDVEDEDEPEAEPARTAPKKTVKVAKKAEQTA